jgi:Zn-dependent protease
MMRSTFTIARVRGIDLGVNWSWLIIFGLITLSLAAETFPRTNPGLGAATYVPMALVGSFLFFGSLLLHELGHALQAEREGMQIEGITLWLFGGVAKFTGMFPSAGAEFRIAIAGPLVTLTIATVLSVAAALLSLPAAVDGVIVWLGMINVFLLVFNMIPAFPLDGGRVLRSALWKFRGDFAKATHTAGAVGRAFGQFFIGAGVLLAFLAGAPGGLWLALIGWFIMVAGQAEARMVALRETFKGMTVADLMVSDPETAPAQISLRSFVDRVLPRHRYNAYPVLGSDSMVIGILPVRNVKATSAALWDQATVSEHMVPLDKALKMGEQKDLGDAVTELVQTDLGRALVMRDGRLNGLLSITDVQRALEMPRSGAAPVA